MKNVIILVLAVTLFGLTAYSFADSELDRAPRIGLEEFKALHAQNAVFVVDVRYPRDYEADHIPGAVLMPLEFISSYLSELREVNQPIVTYCH